MKLKQLKYLIIILVLLLILISNIIFQNELNRTVFTSTSNRDLEKGPILDPRLLFPFELTIKPRHSSYLPGEVVEIELTLEHTGSKPINISPFPPEIKVKRPNPSFNQPFLVVRSFSPSSKKIKLDPGEKITYLLRWNQQDENGIQVSPGFYEVGLYNFTVENPEFGISKMGYTSSSHEVFINFPHGAMNKTLSQSQTSDGVNLTLTLKLFSRGAQARALVQFSNYTLPFKGLPSPILNPPRSALYSVDNGTQQVLDGSLVFREEGIILSWNMIDPVPSDAKEITFVITGLSVRGFRIPTAEFNFTLN